MQPRAAALLWDLHTAATRIQEFVEGRTWEEYAEDVLLRSAVERQFEIHGYAEINDLTVWRTATGDLDALITAVDALLVEAGPPTTEDGGEA